MAATIAQHPRVNVSWKDSAIIQHPDIKIAYRESLIAGTIDVV